jgi:hypothetical protein
MRTTASGRLATSKKEVYGWVARSLPPPLWFRLYPAYARLIRRRSMIPFTASRVAPNTWRIAEATGSVIHISSPARIDRYIRGGGIAQVLDALWVKYIDPKWHLPPDATVIDVGANIGEFSMALKGRLPAAHVWCFEPDPVVREALLRNVTRPEFVKVLTIALGERHELATFYRSSQDADLFPYLARSGRISVARRGQEARRTWAPGTRNRQDLTLEDGCRGG